MHPHDEEDFDDRIAVIGMAARFPSAPDLETYWANLLDGVDGLTTFTIEQLVEMGLDPDAVRQDNFVPRGSILAGHDTFDAERFGLTPREAAITDPQARVLLEASHTALEHAGYDPFAVPGEVGVFAGCNPVDHALLLGRPDATDSLTSFDQMIGNDRDFLATRVSHRLGLTGPAFNVQTACSTSLVAIHLAATHLIDDHCSMALAGGVAINYRQGVGYFYQPGMILSPDGVCRAFDDGANGTTLGQGVGVVVLKRLADALADGDTVHAVIAASAINNDGASKISYTAPSVEGQARVIATAHALAGLDGDDITYIETHGTGTKLGDPVEIAGLTRAFRLTSETTGHCAVGSVKTNIGHADAAAGVAGFIKAVLAVRDGVIPASLNYTSPNRAIDFAGSPFYVATETAEWRPETTDARRAGVSSFGIGGTNAHVIVEEAPAAEPSPAVVDRPLLLTASAPAVDNAADTLEAITGWAADGRLGVDELNTLTLGRRAHPHRVVAVHDPRTGATSAPRRAEASTAPEVVLAFSGQGSQSPGMGAASYDSLPVFRTELDRAIEAFRTAAGIDLARLLLGHGDHDELAERLRQTEVTQPALFAVQHAMARQLEAWGVAPDVLLGHSIGEFAAATIAGVFGFDDAVAAVAARGRLMQAMEPGGMVATRLSVEDLARFLDDPAADGAGGVEVATINSTAATVAAGPHDAIDRFCALLDAAGEDHTRLATSHAFHTRSMERAAGEFAEVLGGLRLAAPERPILSNVTGTWLTDDEARDPEFWASQIRRPVRFADCLAELTDRTAVLCEVGPGRALSAFASAHSGFASPMPAVQCSGHARDPRPDDVIAVEAVGQLWTHGVEIDAEAVHGGPFRRRRPVPPSVLAAEPCWAPDARHVLALPEPGSVTMTSGTAPPALERAPLAEWGHGRSWRRLELPAGDSPQRILALVLDDPWHRRLVAELTARFEDVIEVRLGDRTDLTGEIWTVAPADDDGLRAVFDRLEGTSRRPDRVVCAWLVDDVHQPRDLDVVRRQLACGVDTLLSLARAAARTSQQRNILVDVLTAGAHDVLGGETVRPAAAAVAGPVKVIPLEYSGIRARQLDLALDHTAPVGRVVDLIAAGHDDRPVAALRGTSRWVHEVQTLTDPGGDIPLRSGGRYLILGGLGGVGLGLAEHLAVAYDARLALTSRSGEPAPDPEDPERTRRVQRLAEVRTVAAQVVTRAADVTSPEELSATVEWAERELGGLDGVIVTAAVADTAGAIHRRSPAEAEAAISAKAHGAVLLADALKGRRLDLVMLSSSIASQLYHNRFGQVGYVIANSFAEAMAESDAFDAERVVTIAWDDWVDIGMSVRAAQAFSADHGEDITLMDEIHSFTPADGVRVFEMALRMAAPTVFVSTTDLADRIVADRDVSSPFLDQAVAGDDAGETDAGSVEDSLRLAWSGLLGIDDITPEDDFFALGGDSLQVARMADRLSRSLDREVPLDLIFDTPRFVDLVTAIEALAPEDGTERETIEVTGSLPLAPSQRRFFDRGSKNPHHFNVSVLLAPKRPLDPGVLQEAVSELEQRHSALRTRFEDDPQGWRQRVEPPGAGRLVVSHHDLTGAAAPEAALAVVASGLQAGFDLRSSPLAAVAWFDLPGGEQRLLVVVHHLVADRMSLLTFIDELDSLLDGQSLRPVAVPFSTWCDAVAGLGTGPEADELVDRWASLLPAREPTLPGEPGPNLNRSADGHRLELSTDRSTAVLRHPDARADELVLAALARALDDWSDDEQPVGIDVMGHGRRHMDLDVGPTVGFFLSYSPVWLTPSGRDRAGLVADVRSQLDWTWTFDPLRFSRPAETLHWVRPRVLFNYVGRPIAADESKVLEVVPGDKGVDTDPDNRRDHDLAVMVEVTEADRVAITIVFDGERFDRASIKGLAAAIAEGIDESGSWTAESAAPARTAG